MNPPLLTVKEVSLILHMHYNTVYKLVEEGKINHCRFGNRLRISQKNIDDFINKRIVNFVEFPQIFPKNEQISLSDYDKIFLKGENALSKKSKRWNYGFGSIYTRKTKKGRERWYVDFRNENGKRIQKVVKTALRKEDALISLQAEVAQIFNREHHQTPKMKNFYFSQFVEMYIENYAKVNKRSWKDDQYRLRKFETFFGNVHLKEITGLEIEKFKLSKLKDGTKKSTVNRYLAILKRLYNVAIEWGYAKENPVRHVKFFPENDNLMERILTPEEEDCLFEAASEHLRPILVVALNTGMRRGEILNLHWHQVDLYSREIRVEKTKSGKTRVVDINSVLFEEFKRLKNESQNNPYVFPNPKTGEPYKKLQTSFTGACRRAGIVGLRMHDLRHTFASRLVERGVDLIRVKELLGHSTVRITERYTHSNKDGRKKAVELLCKKPSETTQNLEDLLHHGDISEDKKNIMIASSLFSVN